MEYSLNLSYLLLKVSVSVASSNAYVLLQLSTDLTTAPIVREESVSGLQLTNGETSISLSLN